MIQDKPILYYTLEMLESVAWLDEIIVPVSEDRLEWVEGLLVTWGFKKTKVIVGGATRHRSIARGVAAIGPFPPRPLEQRKSENAHLEDCTCCGGKPSSSVDISSCPDTNTCTTSSSSDGVGSPDQRHVGIDPALEVEEKPNLLKTVVVVHDAVRPFLDEETLFKVALAAFQHGAAGASWIYRDKLL